MRSESSAAHQRAIGNVVKAIACGSVCALSLLLSMSNPGHAQQPLPTLPEYLEPVSLLMQQGKLSEAKSALEPLLKDGKDGADGYILLGIIDSSQRDFASAESAFRHALLLAPHSSKARNDLGNVYVALNKVDLAEKEFRAVLRSDPKNADANYNLGVLLLARGSANEAVSCFEKVQPANNATKINLIRALLQSKRTAEALKLSSDLSGQEPQDVSLHFSLGLMLASEKQYNPAQLELAKADFLQPGTFEILYNLGLALLRNGDFAKADLVTRRALALKPESPETLYLLAQILADQSKPLDALDLLVRAHKLSPNNTDIILLMAQISISQDYFEDAIPLLESGIKISPQRSDLLAALGESYFMSGKVDRATQQFKKLVDMEPSARSYAFLGLSYRHLGRFDEAKQYFQLGLKLDPRNSSCLFNLGFIAERQGDAAAAESMFEEILKFNPNYADALLELANLRTAERKLPEAESLLRRYVQASHDPATGYYKLAMVERSLHETAAADRDLSVFQTLSKDAKAGPYPFENLFDYLDNRSKLAPEERNQLDLKELTQQTKQHPDQPEDLYLLAQTYLKSGNAEQARSTIAQLDQISSGDYRTMTGVGVLLARYNFYDDAIRHFQSALASNPDLDDVKFDLMNAYFRKGSYSQALDVSHTVSEPGQKDDAYLALLGDIDSHLGQVAQAKAILDNAIQRNPDNDQNYLSLALLEFREQNFDEGKATLLKAQARIPGSGKILWGLGIASALEGRTADAATQLEHSVDIMPEWPGSYSVLGVFYFETGQITKAKEVLDRFKNSSAHSALNVDRIEAVLAQAPENPVNTNEPMSLANRQLLLQLALSLADRTL